MVRLQLIVTTAALALAGSVSSAQIGTTRVASGLDLPMFVAPAPGDPNRLYVLERGGDVEILDLSTGTVNPAPFLDVPAGQVNGAGEGGMLGLAFDPDFASNGRFYVNMTTGTVGSGSDPFRNEIRRYIRTSPDTAATTFETLLSYNQPFTNHNGGWIGFNPTATGPARHDLYIATGDGGSSNDPGNNAQDTTDNLLGKMLRINVSGASGYTSPPTNPFVGVTGDDEILAHGLRNPFRASFDRVTGELYIGDVGQGAREEVDVFDPAVIDPGTGRAPIRNFGWRLREGTIQNPASVGGSPPPNNVEPIYDYRRLGTPGYPDELEGNTVTGGVLYRGPVADLQGLYIFGDYISDRIWAFDPADPYGTITDLTDVLTPPTGEGTIANIVAFSEDAAGNLYIVDLLDGEVFQVVPEPAAASLIAASGLLLRRLRRRA